MTGEIDSDTDRKEKPDIPVACRQNNLYPPSGPNATLATGLSRKDTLSSFNRMGKAAAFPLLNINNLVYTVSVADSHVPLAPAQLSVSCGLHSGSRVL